MFGVIQFAFFPFATIQGNAFEGQVWVDQCKSISPWENQEVEQPLTTRCNNAT